MDKTSVHKKVIVFVIITIFFTISIIPSISGDTNKINEEQIIISKQLTGENDDVDVTFYSFGIDEQSTNQIQMSNDEVEILLDQISEYSLEFAKSPQTKDVQQLQQEIFTQFDELGILPKDIQQNLFDSPVNRRKTRFTPVPILQNRASAFFCNFATTGTGSQFPVIIFPRLIPIIQLPIPRVFLRWKATEGITSCGGLVNGKGYIAYGQQKGTALGFWGIGFSVFLPPIMQYGFIGYALFASTEADEIELWPPNNPPDISPIDPYNDEINVPLSTSELQFEISDFDDDLMNYIVTTLPDVGSGSGNLKPDGEYSIPVSNLVDLTTYTWQVEVSDGEDTTINDFSFTTEAVAPIVSNPSPDEDERNVPIDISYLSFHLKDFQDDPIDYTVETSPNIGSGSGSDVGEGTYFISVSGLDYNTEYLWFVNTSDGEHESRKVFSFQSELEMTFDPFNSGWMYRKRITIDHILVDGDLENFPVLVSITDVDLRDKAQVDGDDILFMADVGVADRLFHEIESYDESTGELIAWVNVDDLYSYQDSNLYLYYGNPNAGDQQAPELVWDPNFKAVWHYRDFKDSTVHNNNGNNHGSTDISGKINIAKNFDGENDYISISDDSSLNFHSSNKFSISFWLSKRLSDKYESIVSKGTTAYNKGYHVQIKANYSISFGIRTGSEFFNCYSNTKINDADWHYVVSVWDGVKLYIYIDGNLDVSRDIGEKTIADDHKSLEIGDHYPLNNGHKFAFDGILEEMRFSNIDYDAEWISTEYHNQNDPSSFYSVGPEVSSP